MQKIISFQRFSISWNYPKKKVKIKVTVIKGKMWRQIGELLKIIKMYFYHNPILRS